MNLKSDIYSAATAEAGGTSRALPKERSLMKQILVLVLVSSLVGGGVYLWKGRTSERAAESPQTTTAKAQRGSLRIAVAATGRVVSNLDVEIKAKSSGEIVKLPVDVADAVKKGDLLIELDPVDEQRRLEQSEMAVAAAKARLEQSRAGLVATEQQTKSGRKGASAELRAAQASAADAKAKAERAKMLYNEKLISRQDYETARTTAVQAAAQTESVATRLEEADSEKQNVEVKRQEVRAAEAQVQSAEVDLKLQQQRIHDTVVVAPMDGIVTARNVQIGQIISSGISNVGGGTSALVLSDLSRLFVLAAVDESDIGRVEVGQEAVITADAFPGREFEGKVERIASRGVNNQNVVTFEVKIEVLGRNKSLLKPEMTANVEVVTAEKQDALLVPEPAVTRKGRERMVTVVLPGGGTEERAVKTGLSDGARIEVLEGLAEGDTVRVQEGQADSRWRRGAGDRQRQQGLAGGARMMMGGGGAGRGR